MTDVSNTCMRYRKSYEVGCNTPDHCCPEYTPDFIALAESYGAKGIPVTKGLSAARQNDAEALCYRVD